MRLTPWQILWIVPPVIILISFSVTTLIGWSFVWMLCLPFGGRMVRTAEDYLYAILGWAFAFFFNTWVRTEYVFYGDDLPKKPENVILLSNHQCAVDWLILEFLTYRANAAGYMRYILKDVLRLIPVYGFIVNRHGGIFVRRRGGKDKEKIHDELKKMADQKRPMWVCLFPEGTRYDPSKVSVKEKSKAFAESHGLPTLKHVLTPHTTGFETVMEVGKKYFTSIYDVTMMYELDSDNGNQNGDLPAPPNPLTFVGGICKRVHIHLHRREIIDLPDEPEELKKWLYERYTEKDRILETLANGEKAVGSVKDLVPRKDFSPISSLRLNLAFALALGTFLFHLLHTYGPLLWMGTLVAYSFLGVFIAFYALPF